MTVVDSADPAAEPETRAAARARAGAAEVDCLRRRSGSRPEACRADSTSAAGMSELTAAEVKPKVVLAMLGLASVA